MSNKKNKVRIFSTMSYDEIIVFNEKKTYEKHMKQNIFVKLLKSAPVSITLSHSNLPFLIGDQVQGG